MINGAALSYAYDCDEGNIWALDGVDITVSAGEFVAILGRNGCGKSTLAKLLSGLLPLQDGTLVVAELDARDSGCRWELRRRFGMVFQNPDNQFVSSLVEEDLSFGLANYDTPPQEISRKIAAALAQVGMDGFQTRDVHTLSGGQKQRVALAAILSLEPDILLFDEATAMLDPQGRREVLGIMEVLHRKRKTILMITHNVEETLSADKMILMGEGHVRACGTPRELLTDPALLLQCGLLPPLVVQIYMDLAEKGIVLPRCPLTQSELVEALCQSQ